MAYNIVLVEPEIPTNTGNIGRLSLASGANLHLVKPFGFEITDARLKRAGLDYWQHLSVHFYENIEEFYEKNADKKMVYLSSHGTKTYDEIPYENRALPSAIAQEEWANNYVAKINRAKTEKEKEKLRRKFAKMIYDSTDLYDEATQSEIKQYLLIDEGMDLETSHHLLGKIFDAKYSRTVSILNGTVKDQALAVGFFGGVVLYTLTKWAIKDDPENEITQP